MQPSHVIWGPLLVETPVLEKQDESKNGSGSQKANRLYNPCAAPGCASKLLWRLRYHSLPSQIIMYGIVACFLPIYDPNVGNYSRQQWFGHVCNSFAATACFFGHRTTITTRQEYADDSATMANLWIARNSDKAAD